MHRAVCFVALLIILPQLSGCFMANWQRLTAPTTGRELMDLKVAFDQGAITSEEYLRKREELLQGQAR